MKISKNNRLYLKLLNNNTKYTKITNLVMEFICSDMFILFNGIIFIPHNKLSGFFNQNLFFWHLNIYNIK